MKKLKDILNESQHSYNRMNVGEDKEKEGMTNEEKREFLKAVSEYKRFGESIYRSGNLGEIYESIKGIVETAHKVTLEETGDWFDKVTVGRHMKSMNESFKVFEKTISEVNTLQQRLESAYDEMGEVLGKYYEIKEGNEFGAERAKAIAKGQDEFEVGGKKFKVTNVDKEDKENAKDFANEAYVKSMGFKAVSERIDGLTKSLDPNGILCKKISQQADNVKPEFKQMKKRIDEIEQIWGEVEYTIEMSKESVNEDTTKPSLSNTQDKQFASAIEKVVGGKVVTRKSRGLGSVFSLGDSDIVVYVQKVVGNKAFGQPSKFVVYIINKNLTTQEYAKEFTPDANSALKLVVKLAKKFKSKLTESESVVNEGKHDSMLDKLADMVKGVDFMNVGKELKKNGIKYSFSTSMIPMYKIDKLPIAIVNKKYAAGAEREVGDIAIGLMESIKEEKSMKLTDILSENKYSIIDPKGNQKGVGPKDAANKRAKALGGAKKGYFVVPAKSALKARRAMEKYKFDFKNAKLQDMMSDLYFEGVEESVNEGASTEEKRIVMMAVKKIAKYRNVPLNYAVGDVIRAAEELDRDIQKGKVKK